jgi:hypothetical protein
VNYQGLLDSVAGDQAQADAQVAAQQTSLDANSTRQNDILQRLGLRSQVQQQKEADAGVTGLSQTVRDYNTKLATLEGQAATMRERVTEANRATGRSGYDLNLIESGASRANAIDRVSTAAMLQAARGNLSDAQAQAQRATDMEFEPLEAELKVREKQYEQNKDLLGRYDKKASAAYAQKLELQQKQIADQKEQANGIRSMAIEAAKNQAPQEVVQAVANSKNFAEAFASVRGYLTDPNSILQSEHLRQQILTQKTNRANSNLDALIKRAQAGDPKAAASLGLDTQDTSKVRLSVREAIGVQKDISNDDNLKAINKASDTWRAISEYEKQVDTNGATSWLSPIQYGKSGTVHKTALLNSKEYFNLGVLNGPDLGILEEILPSNQTVTPVAPFKAITVKNGIQNLKTQFNDKLDTDYLSVSSRYSNYDKNQLPQLRDVDAKYIQMKSQMDPKVDAFVKANPDMLTEDVIKVINNRI